MTKNIIERPDPKARRVKESFANLFEVVDSEHGLIAPDSSNPCYSSIEKMRESQRLGSIGTGTQSDDYGAMESDFNIGGRGSKEKDMDVNKASGFDPWNEDKTSYSPWE